MPRNRLRRPALLPLAILCAGIQPEFAAAADPILQDEIVIDAGEPAGAMDEIVIEDVPNEGAAGANELIIEDAAPGQGQMATAPSASTDDGALDVRIDDAWVEYGHFLDRDSTTDDAFYGKVSALANWQPAPAWEFQIAGRIDGYDENGRDGFSKIKADYGDSYVRYRGDGYRLTFGTQTVVWGRIDELPLADRVSTADLTRMVLDDLEDRRRSNPMVRAETFVGGGKLDLVWLFDFRPAELPDKDSVWYPIDRQRGRILGIDPDDVPPAAVQGASISEDAPDGDGGFGARYTRTHSFADIGVTIANTRQSVPYFRSAGVGRFEAEYPRSWAYGADAAIDAAGATWRVEVLYSSDNPVTRSDMSYTTTPAVMWAGGVEFHPGDGDTRINLQLVGMNLIDSPSIIDREKVYSVNGEVEIPFDRERWKLKLDFYAGLDQKDVYLNPEIAFLGWEPHELYLALHYFDGSEQTLGGFHEDHSSINLGWRAKF